MNIAELFLLAAGLSMDAFAAAVCAGLTMPELNIRKALIIGLYFGIFQAAMPLAGYLAASLFADMIIDYDHWTAFVLLCFLGGRMIAASFKKEGCSDRLCPSGICDDRACPGGEKPGIEEASVSAAHMLPLAVATSIDALAAGVSFAFLRIRIVPAVTFIGITTFSLSVLGVKIGNKFGLRYKSKAELAGGLILVLIGFKILFEHLNIFSF